MVQRMEKNTVLRLMTVEQKLDVLLDTRATAKVLIPMNDRNVKARAIARAEG